MAGGGVRKGVRIPVYQMRNREAKEQSEYRKRKVREARKEVPLFNKWCEVLALEGKKGRLGPEGAGELILALMEWKRWGDVERELEEGKRKEEREHGG